MSLLRNIQRKAVHAHRFGGAWGLGWPLWIQLNEGGRALTFVFCRDTRASNWFLYARAAQFALILHHGKWELKNWNKE